MSAAVEALEKFWGRELARFEGRIFALQRKADQLASRFPGAESLQKEVFAALENERSFLVRSRDSDLATQLEAVRAELDALVLQEEGPPEELSLKYELPTGVFRSKKGTELLRGADFLEALLESDKKQGMVSYPIIFTHEGELNQQALVGAMNWAILDTAVQEVFEGTVHGVRLLYKEIELQISRKGGAQEERSDEGGLEEEELEDGRWPGAPEFGFVPQGELFRRIEEFSTADPQAHWEDWLGEEWSAIEKECEMTLREQGGGFLRILVDVAKGLIVEEFRPRTALIRKRTNLFAEEQPFRVSHRYYSSAEKLNASLVESLDLRIIEGFRFVYCRIDEKEPRGFQSA